MASHENYDHNAKRQQFGELFRKQREQEQINRMNDRAAFLEATGGNSITAGNEPLLTGRARLGSREGPRVIDMAKLPDDPDCLRVSIGEVLFRSSPIRCYVRYRGDAARVLALLRASVVAMEGMVEAEEAKTEHKEGS